MVEATVPTRVYEHQETGALITMFSAYGLGFLAALPVTDEAVAPAAEPAAAREPAGTQPAPRRRGLLRRRSRRGQPQPVEQPVERR